MPDRSRHSPHVQIARAGRETPSTASASSHRTAPDPAAEPLQLDMLQETAASILERVVSVRTRIESIARRHLGSYPQAGDSNTAKIDSPSETTVLRLRDTFGGCHLVLTDIEIELCRLETL